MQKPIIPVVCAVIVNNGLVLAVRRGPEQSMAGHWEFPGGKVESKEGDKEALVREIEEELAVNVILNMRLQVVIWEDDNRIIELRPYFAEIAFGTVTLHEHDQQEWLSPSELLKLNWAPADIAVVEQVIVALSDA